MFLQNEIMNNIVTSIASACSPVLSYTIWYTSRSLCIYIYTISNHCLTFININNIPLYLPMLWYQYNNNIYYIIRVNYELGSG